MLWRVKTVVKITILIFATLRLKYNIVIIHTLKVFESRAIRPTDHSFSTTPSTTPSNGSFPIYGRHDSFNSFLGNMYVESLSHLLLTQSL